VLVTFALKVQLEPAVRLAPESEIVDPPAVALIVPDGHEPVTPFGVETTMLAGNVSENPIPVRVVDGLLLTGVKLTVALWP
jgi:hypothetical protein